MQMSYNPQDKPFHGKDPGLGPQTHRIKYDKKSASSRHPAMEVIR
ncbi:MAG: hypothetical protein OXC42_01100 [Gammaproteobacteria bacterium]|nr:hypothetical protein [Gammaproteobacteria bacterium]